MPDTVTRICISLPISHADAVRALAAREYNGRVSRAISGLIEDIGLVTTEQRRCRICRGLLPRGRAHGARTCSRACEIADKHRVTNSGERLPRETTA